eukprot:TRINITY_DN2831_c0_g2_i1.p1 TRINITY_DN2831_c0_g2~~TRINITY_DN2831_c0_g2_i1.p1  ORF type:complete len:716 (+),score=177.62 TRINITY_DN2831_c0_g2_i1:246-2150(+)
MKKTQNADRRLTKAMAFHLDAPATPAPLPPTTISNWSDLPEDLFPNLHTGRPEEFYESLRYKTKKGTGVLIDDYQLGEKLGEGNLGAVYKGLNILTGDFAAVKRLPIKDLYEDQLKCLQNEITLLQSLRHDNIVKYLGVIKSQRHVNLILEYVEGGSLAQVMAGYGVFPESLAAIYIQQVLKGLSYLHSSNIIHRDIKASNLLITKEGVIKLSDFGVSMSLTTGTDSVRNSTFEKRSPYWMAPEMIRFQLVTTACDIWSIGCTIIELLTGYPPYFDKSVDQAAARMIEDDHPTYPHRLSQELQSFMDLSFQKEPKKRPTAQQLLSHEWVTKGRSVYKDGVMGVNRLKGTLHKYNSFYKVTVESIDWRLKSSQNAGTGAAPEEVEDPTNLPPPNLHLEAVDSPPLTPTQATVSTSSLESSGTGSALKSIKSSIEPLSRGLLGVGYEDSAEDERKRLSNSPTRSREKASTLGVLSGGLTAVDVSSPQPDRRHSTIAHPLSTDSSSKRKKSKKRFNFKDLRGIDAPQDGGTYSVSLLNTESRKNFWFSFTEYKFRVEFNGKSWDMQRTYDDFKELKTKLEKALPSEKLPALPPSKFFGAMDPEFVKKRSGQLMTFLNNLLQIPAVAQSPVFTYFLQP